MNITRTARRFMSRRPIVGGNWKCNPVSAKALPDLVANIEACDTSKVDVYVCPSPLHVALCDFKNGAKIAPQNMNFTGCGAYTGEMAADQMVDMGIEWVLMYVYRRGLSCTSAVCSPAVLFLLRLARDDASRAPIPSRIRMRKADSDA